MFAQVLRQPPYAGQNDADTNRISSSVQSLEKIGTYGYRIFSQQIARYPILKGCFQGAGL
jgi:hypothetical protein